MGQVPIRARDGTGSKKVESRFRSSVPRPRESKKNWQPGKHGIYSARPPIGRVSPPRTRAWHRTRFRRASPPPVANALELIPDALEPTPAELIPLRAEPARAQPRPAETPRARERVARDPGRITAPGLPRRESKLPTDCMSMKTLGSQLLARLPATLVAWTPLAVLTPLVFAPLVFTASGCSGGSSSSSGSSNAGPMFVDTCSLGCSGGLGGTQVSCSTVATSVNNEISVYFSEAVDENTVSSTTFQLIDVNSGQVPIGTRLVDPNNPRRVIFRPSVTFDTQGNAAFGFEENTTYRITIPGQSQGDNPPFITSRGGKANRSRMQCDIQTTGGIVDLVAGAPVANMLVDLAILATPDPNDRIVDQEGNGADNVWRSTKIKLVFNDIMNPVTLINQATGQPTFITVRVDPDGDLQTTADQVPLPGSFTLQIDPDNLRTTLVFTSPTGIPSGGAAHLRKVVVNIPNNITDLSGRPLANAGLFAFTPETVLQPPVTLPDADGENFNDTSNCNLVESSAIWGSGKLVRGQGAGSGRLGRLFIRAGQQVILNTDSTTFPLLGMARDLLDNALPGVDYTPTNPLTWPTITVTDGIFEFTRITIEAGGVLTITGTQPARILSRGDIEIFGLVDVRGGTPVAFDSETAAGQSAADAGPGAGRGGDGGDRPTYGPGTSTLLNAGAITNPLVGLDTNGQPSSGIDQDVGGLGAAAGGLHFPDIFPTFQNSFGGLQLQDPDPLNPDSALQCFSFMVANGGGGGGYATPGSNAVPMTPFPLAGASPNTPPVAGNDGVGGPGGTNINIEAPNPLSAHVVRRLDAGLGFLRGGAGGGGGGCHLFGSFATGSAPNCTVGGSLITTFSDASGCAGGSGGGALQIASGKTLRVAGLLDARGGNGGSGLAPVTGAPTRKHRAAPGGGGSGGAVRLQALVVDVDTVSTPGVNGRIDVRGGVGGGTDHCLTTGTCLTRSRGGNGGNGLIRIEDTTGLLTRASEAPKLLPFTLADLESLDTLSVGTWQLPRRRPESFSGAVSCWMRPPGNFFEVNFQADDPLAVNPDERFGWNMEVLYDDGGPLGLRAINYRGPDTDSPFPVDLETQLKNNLNYGLAAADRSYFAVRFQGARLAGTYNGSLCDVNVGTSPGLSNLVDGSLTPWVRHPEELNEFAPRPTIVRFAIVFDTALEQPASVPSFIKGVRNLKIRTKPD